ncbi:MAG: DUF58 domain-containing protein, partial [Proteobacteria bacterium]|nr:DUF58 domain-containing protein [Pseudomonadota bacterium]
MNFNQCLIHAPAENAPYLTAFGLFILTLILGEIILAIACFAYELADPAAFLAAAAASKAFMLTFENVRMIATWKALRNNTISCSPALSSNELTQNSRFNLKLHVHYPFTHASDIEAIRWVHTDNLKIHNFEQEAFHIRPCSDNEITFPAETLQAGYGKILGLAVLTISPLRCFMAENHIEFNICVPILPVNGRKMHFHAAHLDSLASNLRNALNSPSAEFEPEELRPWQNTDAMRRIAWNYYARSGKLMVWHSRGRTMPTLVCIIDAGPSMRLTRPDHNSCLSIAMTMMTQISADFQAMSVIAYDEIDAGFIAENRTPAECIKASSKWFLKTLEWNPECIRNTKQWNDAVQMIHNDFRLYKHVNFTRKGNGQIILDSKALAEWAKSDLALSAVDARHPETAAQILKMPAQEMLFSLIKQRSRTTQPPLM